LSKSNVDDYDRLWPVLMDFSTEKFIEGNLESLFPGLELVDFVRFLRDERERVHWLISCLRSRRATPRLVIDRLEATEEILDAFQEKLRWVE
jgi:hypothetical protein